METERYEENIFEKIEHTLYLLEEEWNEMNLPEHQKYNRRLVLINGLRDVCDTALANEKLIKERIIKRIEDNRIQLLNLCQELCLSHELPQDMPMLDLDNYLNDKLTELLEIKEERLTELRTLAQRDKMICNYLDEIPFQISEDVIPSQEAIDKLKNHILEMETEKVKRIETYKMLRKDILSFAEVLKKPIEGDVLLDIVCNTDQEYSLTKVYLLEIRKLHSDLEFDVKEMESYSLELREKIALLWNQLQIPSTKQETFLSTVPGHNPSSIEKLENHLSELKELRLQNLGKFIKDLKTELQKWWEKCFVGENQKKSFLHLDSDDVAEEVLEAFEFEVKKWKEYYNENSIIFEKVEHLLGLFDMMQQLEEKAKDPSRLFNTRGGTLLQEEKERKRVSQELPIVQEQLIVLCQKYDAKNDTPFRIDGETAEEYLSNLWEYHNLLKEKEKVDRQNRNKAGTTPKSTSKISSAKSLPSIIITPAGSHKRGREGSDLDGKFSAKRRPKTPSGPYSCFQSPLKEQRTPGNMKNVRKTAKTLTERNHLPPPPSRKNLLSTDNIVMQSPLSYDNFKAELSGVNSKEIVHSSVLCSDSTASNDEILSKGCQEINPTYQGREFYLKTTLNLASPLKRCRNPQNQIIVPGGAPRGTYLVRSISQPNVMKSFVSPPKRSGKSKRCVWKP